MIFFLFIASLSPIDIEIVPTPAASACPKGDALDAAVAEHVAQPAVPKEARWHARVRFDRDDSWLARIDFTDASGATLGARTLRSWDEDCGALARAVAFSLGFSWLSAHPNHSHPLFADALPAAVKPVRGLQLSAGGMISGFAVPGFGYGAIGAAGFRARRWSLALEFEWQGAASPLDGVNVSRTTGALSPCLRWGRWLGCVALGGGAIMSSGPNLSHGAVPWWGAARARGH